MSVSLWFLLGPSPDMGLHPQPLALGGIAHQGLVVVVT